MYHIVIQVLDFYSEAPGGPEAAATNRPNRQPQPNGPPRGPLGVSGHSRRSAAAGEWTTVLGGCRMANFDKKSRRMRGPGARPGRARWRCCSSSRRGDRIGKLCRGARWSHHRRLKQELAGHRGRHAEEPREASRWPSGFARVAHTVKRGSRVGIRIEPACRAAARVGARRASNCLPMGMCFVLALSGHCIRTAHVCMSS